eukprot:7356003-Prorocentrum_lima.AAC.1
METHTSSNRSAFCASGTNSSLLASGSITCLPTDAHTHVRQGKARTSISNEFDVLNAIPCSCSSPAG